MRFVAVWVHDYFILTILILVLWLVTYLLALHIDGIVFLAGGDLGMSEWVFWNTGFVPLLSPILSLPVMLVLYARAWITDRCARQPYSARDEDQTRAQDAFQLERERVFDDVLSFLGDTGKFFILTLGVGLMVVLVGALSADYFQLPGSGGLLLAPIILSPEIGLLMALTKLVRHK